MKEGEKESGRILSIRGRAETPSKKRFRAFGRRFLVHPYPRKKL